MPNEHFVYLGDTARVPYGTKSLATVERYAVENARFLEAHGIKLLVVACNTASALALPAIRRAIDVEVIGVIKPGAEAAVAAAEGKPIVVIATEATVQSGAYSREIERIVGSVTIIERACPLFVPLAEEGWAATDIALEVARHYLDDLANLNTGALVLGCTHYPILQGVISRAMGGNVTLIDSGQATAVEVERLLQRESLSRQPSDYREEERQLCDDLDHFYVTDAAQRFSKVAERFLGAAPSVLEAVEIWGHDELRTH